MINLAQPLPTTLGLINRSLLSIEAIDLNALISILSRKNLVSGLFLTNSNLIVLKPTLEGNLIFFSTLMYSDETEDKSILSIN